MNEKVIALVGQPNAGKSTLFNVLSDIKIETSNFAGTTVKLAQSKINFYGSTYKLIDLPGTYSLNPNDGAEEVTYNYLLNENIDLIINVVDSANLPRSLEVTIELIELGIPMVVALNMLDESERHGLIIDAPKLSKLLNIPIIKTTTLYGKGVTELLNEAIKLLDNQAKTSNIFKYTNFAEKKVELLEDAIASLNIPLQASNRFYAIKAIENYKFVPSIIQDSINNIRTKIKNELVEYYNKDCFEIISYERHHLAMKISEEATSYKTDRKRPFREILDNYLLHPIFGYAFLIVFFFVYFYIIFVVGGLISSVMAFPLDALANIYKPLKDSNIFLYYTIDGFYQALYGAIGIVIPYFVPLVFLTTFFEDSGYLARIAFLIDGLMHKIGLHGKSAVPFVLGFGCSVPAIYSTRMIENKTERTVAAMLIPFIPCSARISVIFALTAAFTGPIWAIVIFFWVLLVIAINGKILSKFLTKPIGLILEIPSIKVPSIANSLKKTWFKIYEFLKDVLPFLIIGSLVLGWIEYFHLHIYLNKLFHPIINTVLGLPDELGSTLLFGFFRKELILIMANQAFGVSSISLLPMLPAQIIVFVVFVTLYFPCFTTFIVLWKEFGWKVVLFSSILSIIVALISAFCFKLILSI